jgi:hypothetical protein
MLFDKEEYRITPEASAPSPLDIWLHNFAKNNPAVQSTQWYLGYVSKYGIFDPRVGKTVPVDAEMADKIMRCNFDQFALAAPQETAIAA